MHIVIRAVTARLLKEKTFSHFYIRAAEHMGISNLTVKRPEKVKHSAISDSQLQCNCAINFDGSTF